MFVLLPLIALAAFLDMHASTVIDANIAHGFPYPLANFAHVIVFLAVGLLAARYRGHRRWALPATFVLLFAVGLAAGMRNPAALTRPIDLAVIASLVLTGTLVLSGRRPKLAIIGPLFAVLAFIHGFAHGMQVSSSDNALRASREIVTAAAILMLGGLSAGALIHFLMHRGSPLSSAQPRETPGSTAEKSPRTTAS